MFRTDMLHAVWFPNILTNYPTCIIHFYKICRNQWGTARCWPVDLASGCCPDAGSVVRISFLSSGSVSCNQDLLMTLMIIIFRDAIYYSCHLHFATCRFVCQLSRILLDLGVFFTFHFLSCKCIAELNTITSLIFCTLFGLACRQALYSVPSSKPLRWSAFSPCWTPVTSCRTGLTGRWC